MSLAGVLEAHRVIVCVGSGGVGKTTTAAALGVRAAMSGKRVLCLTIDPAKRLANSLGITEMRTEEQEIPRELFTAQGLECKGVLYAMMLDTKRTFDELVTKYASTPERRDRILANKIYRYMSTSLAGTQEYMAMEKLFAVRDDERFDLVVLDTPPTSNALDFLDAPERLVGAIDSPAMRWFIQAFESAGKLSLGVVGRGAAFLLRGLSKFTGASFLDEVAALVTDLNELFGGFRDRARQVYDGLRKPDVAFIVVTSPNPLAVAEASFLGKRLFEAGMEHDGFVVNAVHPLLQEPDAGTDALAREAARVLPQGVDPKVAVRKMRRALDDERVRAVADRIEANRVHARVGKDAPYVEVPAFDEDVHDLRGLARVASYLVGEAGEEAS